MSYCRFSKQSDVYLFNTETGIECCACRLTKKSPWYDNVICQSANGALIHLQKHQSAGHKVPKSAIKRLKKEILENITPNQPTIEISERLMDYWVVYSKDRSYTLPKYHACLQGNTGIWSCGKTPEEAVGDLLKSHPDKFPEGRKTPCWYIGKQSR